MISFILKTRIIALFILCFLLVEFQVDANSGVIDPSAGLIEQAKYLLRPVKQYGILQPDTPELPYGLCYVWDKEFCISPRQFKQYLKTKKISANHIGGSIDKPLSKVKKISARYFVIHDTSAPAYKEGRAFPTDINQNSWQGNNLDWEKKEQAGHVYINRIGQSITSVSFEISHTATNYEKRNPKYKGLMLHIELIQPRIIDKRGIDSIAPKPGFTTAQYQRLALTYIAASVRRQSWLVPAYHAAVDHGIKNAHNDPQNFVLSDWAKKVRKIYQEICETIVFEELYDKWIYHINNTPEIMISSWETPFIENLKFQNITRFGIHIVPFMIKKMLLNKYGLYAACLQSGLRDITKKEFRDEKRNRLSNQQILSWWKNDRNISDQDFKKYYKNWKNTNADLFDLGIPALPHAIRKIKGGEEKLYEAVNFWTDNSLQKAADQKGIKPEGMKEFCLKWWDDNKAKWLLPPIEKKD